MESETYSEELLVPSFITDYCTTSGTMTFNEFNACVNYANSEMTITYLSLFFGLVIGFLLAKAVADGWN